jgi:hypothetical protein
MAERRITAIDFVETSPHRPRWYVVSLSMDLTAYRILRLQGTIPMHYFHSPHCADCEDAHPRASSSFHYLIALSSQLNYFLYESFLPNGPCEYDLLKSIQSGSTALPTLVVVSSHYDEDAANPICATCKSGLCPLLAVCLDEKTDDRRQANEPFECLCVENLDVRDEFISCAPLTLHQPMYTTRCNYQVSWWNYVSLPHIVFVSYVASSLLVFIGSTLFLIKSQ